MTDNGREASFWSKVLDGLPPQGLGPYYRKQIAEQRAEIERLRAIEAAAREYFDAWAAYKAEIAKGPVIPPDEPNFEPWERTRTATAAFRAALGSERTYQVASVLFSLLLVEGRLAPVPAGATPKETLMTAPSAGRLDVERLTNALLLVHSWDNYTAMAEAHALATVYAALSEPQA